MKRIQAVLNGKHVFVPVEDSSFNAYEKVKAKLMDAVKHSQARKKEISQDLDYIQLNGKYYILEVYAKKVHVNTAVFGGYRLKNLTE